MRRLWLVLAALALSAGLGNATPITGYSTGWFGGQVCTTDCQYSVLSAGGYQTFSWALTKNEDLSSLTILSSGAPDYRYNFSNPVPATGIRLAGLSWLDGKQNAADFDNLVWNVNVVFTDPVSGGDADAISLYISAKNGVATPQDRDTIVLDDLSGLVFNLPSGYVVSNLRYVGTGFDAATRTWSGTNSDPSTSSELYVVGDFSVVPEPASMLLLGTGVLGLAARLRRRG